MSYVGGPFKNDIFISYSHGSADAQGDSTLTTWSHAFAAELETELRKHDHLRAGLSIYIDKRLDRFAGLTEQLEYEARCSAVLTVLLTPDYLRSEWCTKERSWWQSGESTEPVQMASDGRIALIRVLPVKGGESPWPDELADRHRVPLLGFSFHKEVPGTITAPFSSSSPGSDAFRAALGALVGDLGLKLKELKARVDERERRKAESARLAGSDQVVYLHARTDQLDDWSRARDSLQDRFVVVPAQPESMVRDPAALNQLRSDRVKMLSACDALLLVGSSNGFAVDADMMVVGRQDRHSARAISNRLLPCALLDTVGAPVATTDRRSMARALQVDWIDSTRKPWAPELQEWLLEKSDKLGVAT